MKQRFASPRLRLSPSKTKGLLVTDQARWLPSCEPFYVDVKRYAHAAFKKGCYRSRRNNHTNKALSVVRAFSMVTHTKWKAMWFYRTTAKMRTTTKTTTKGLSTTYLIYPGSMKKVGGTRAMLIAVFEDVDDLYEEVSAFALS